MGSRVACKWQANDSQYHMVRIIERRPVAGSTDPTDYDYYVHYIGCEWGSGDWAGLGTGA